MYMPTKTIYVKESDLPLFEQAQEQLGDSVSAIFAEFLRERLASLTPEQNRVIDLLNQIEQKRTNLKKDRSVPSFVDSEYAEAELYAQKALKSIRAGKAKDAKVYFYAANAYRDRADRDIKDTRELTDKIADLLRA
jgi:hypothetical protein